MIKILLIITGLIASSSCSSVKHTKFEKSPCSCLEVPFQSDKEEAKNV